MTIRFLISRLLIFIGENRLGKSILSSFLTVLRLMQDICKERGRQEFWREAVYKKNIGGRI